MERMLPIYEATFLNDGLTCSIDILKPAPAGWILYEVKSSTKVTDEHELDVAFQVEVASRAGLEIAAVELVHLNKAHRHPGPEPLFTVVPLEEQVAARREEVRAGIERQRAALESPHAPAQDIGTHCYGDAPCPFHARCWEPFPPHHISTLYFCGPRRWVPWHLVGIMHICSVPPGEKLTKTAQRQLASVGGDRMIVESGLSKALAPFAHPLAYLDFETIRPALPIWDGCAPHEQLPVQYSLVVVQADRTTTSDDYLAEPGDCRRELAERLLRECAGVEGVVAYNASFERGCLERLAAALPDLSDELLALAGKLLDLLPVVRDHVYHPDFQGSFSLKSVLPVLVPELTYEGLAIRQGDVASVRLERLLLEPDVMTEGQRSELRNQLIEYCQLDTMAMVRLHEELDELAAGR